jgi:hypothetical protein
MREHTYLIRIHDLLHLLHLLLSSHACFGFMLSYKATLIENEQVAAKRATRGLSGCPAGTITAT